MGVMETPELAPRSPIVGIIATWMFGALVAVAVGAFVPIGDRFVWMAIGAGASLLVAFAINLGYGRVDGFIVRTAASVLGALAAMGVISLVLVLSSLPYAS